MSEAFEGWSLLELMGHRRLGGFVSEAVVAGASLLRIDVYRGDEEAPSATQFYSTSAIYCLTPCEEDLARAVAAQSLPIATQLALPRAPAVAPGIEADPNPSDLCFTCAHERHVHTGTLGCTDLNCDCEGFNEDCPF